MTTFKLTLIDDEPRVLDTDLATGLGLRVPYNIRPMVAANRAELETYGEVLTRRVKTSERGGRPGNAYYLTEGQALVICALSRTANAAKIRKALIMAFMEWRAGKTVNVAAHRRRPPMRDVTPPSPYAHWFTARQDDDARDVRLRPNPDRIQAAYDVRASELATADTGQLLRLMARTMARLDDIAPEPKTYSAWEYDSV